MSIKLAIQQMQAEVDSYGQGTKKQPKDGSPSWFCLRAKTVGLALLKRMDQLQAGDDPEAAERIYKQFSQEIKSAVDA